jgi:hypothetical protein
LDSELAYFCENQASGKPGDTLVEAIFQTGAPVVSGAFERIWADTPCRRPIQAVAFLSFRIVHHRRNLNAFVRRYERNPSWSDSYQLQI